MDFSREQILHIAQLARLELTEDEVARCQRELSDITAYVDKLGELDLEEVEPMTHAHTGGSSLREDAATDGLDRDAILEHAPATHDGMFRVPKVIQEEG